MGYHLGTGGKSISAKAEKNLNRKLEDIWFKEKITFEERLKKGSEILEGWEQYYKNERKVGSILEYVVVIYVTKNKRKNIPKALMEERKNFQNIYKNICIYLSKVWRESGNKNLALFEYEDFFEMRDKNEEVSAEKIDSFCKYYDEIIEYDSEEMWIELMQMYSDAGAYNKSSQIMEYLKKFQNRKESSQQMKRANVLKFSVGEESTQSNAEVKENIKIKQNIEGNIKARQDKEIDKETDIAINLEFLQEYLQTFAGREDTYAKDEIDLRRKRYVEQVAEPLTEEVVKEHLKGKYTVSTYVQRNNQTVKYLVIDVDISKKAFLNTMAEEVLKIKLPEAAKTVDCIMKLLQHMGLKGYLEYSGFRGYHIWIFFTEWIPTRYVTMLTDIIENNLTDILKDERKDIEDEITIEYFPNKGKIRNGNFGQSIKMPGGVHVKTGRKSCMLNDDFIPVKFDKEYLTDIAKFSVQAVKKIIAVFSENTAITESKALDDSLEGFEEAPEQIKIVLQKCNLMRYLCQKARKTGYLTHFERLSVLYVFGHLGENGKIFVHTVMEFTLNYQYHVTEKFIQKLPAKPISCLKLREQYKQITAEYGCSCNFKRTKNCYPSPVLHAIKSSDEVSEDITIPTSRTLSKEKEQKVVEEINIHKKVQELAGRIIEMKKQRRGVDKTIQRVEKELEQIFNQAGIDSIEVDMGILVRRKTTEGYEWLIEI